MGRHRFKCTSTDTVEEGVVFDGHFRMMKSHEGWIPRRRGHRAQALTAR
jgi:hypothetical protein